MPEIMDLDYNKVVTLTTTLQRLMKWHRTFEEGGFVKMMLVDVRFECTKVL